jgi:hypothetical protein
MFPKGIIQRRYGEEFTMKYLRVEYTTLKQKLTSILI